MERSVEGWPSQGTASRENASAWAVDKNAKKCEYTIWDPCVEPWAALSRLYQADFENKTIANEFIAIAVHLHYCSCKIYVLLHRSASDIFRKTHQ